MPPLPDETRGLPAKAEQIMSDVTIHGGLTIATVLYDLVNEEILAGTNITPADFWTGFDQAAHQLAHHRPITSDCPPEILRFPAKHAPCNLKRPAASVNDEQNSSMPPFPMNVTGCLLKRSK